MKTDRVFLVYRWTGTPSTPQGRFQQSRKFSPREQIGNLTMISDGIRAKPCLGLSQPGGSFMVLDSTTQVTETSINVHEDITVTKTITTNMVGSLRWREKDPLSGLL